MEQYKKQEVATDEWYTPIEVIKALGDFDLDPCVPIKPLWDTAKNMYNQNDDGLSKEWHGRVWLNPPYSSSKLWKFMDKMVEHNNGIALLFNNTDSKRFHDVVFNNAKAILFLYDRIKFYYPDGSIGKSPTKGNILIAFGKENANILKECDLKGKYIDINV